MKVQQIFSANPVEEALAASAREAMSRLPGAGDARLAGLRARALARFEATGLPHRRLEDWKYTDLRGFLRKLPEQETAPTDLSAADLASDRHFRALKALDPYWLVFVDGQFAADLSGGPELANGIEAGALSAGIPDWAGDALLSQTAGEVDAVFDLNTAAMADGAFVRVAKGVDAARPVAIVHLGRSAQTRHLRHVIVVEDGARLALAEVYAGAPGTGEILTASALWRVGDRAKVEHLKVQEAAESATHLAHAIWTVGAETTASTFTLTLGGRMAREERRVTCAGEASTLSVSGTYFLDGKAHGDTTLKVVHKAPGCTSRERFKGLVAGSARGVFQGAVLVEQAAQQTDAAQSVDAMLLSDDARHDAKPELEIYADDVQCGHGATTGELDETALFYLRARGLSKADAERLLIAAFVRDGLSAIDHEGLRALAETLAEHRLAVRDPAGQQAEGSDA